MPLSCCSCRMVQVIMNIWTSLLSNPLMSYTIHGYQLSIAAFVDLCHNNELVRCLSCCDEVTYMKLFPLLVSIRPGGIEALVEVRLGGVAGRRGMSKVTKEQRNQLI